MRRTYRMMNLANLLKAVSFSILLCWHVGAAYPDEPTRVPWLQSRFVGAPEPPLPFHLERTFAGIEFNGPLSMTWLPRSNRMVVIEQSAKVWSFDTIDPDSTKSLVVDFRSTSPPMAELDAESDLSLLCFSVAFHPDFDRQPYAYVCYMVKKKGGSVIYADGTHLSRFDVKLSNDGVPSIDVSTEREILRCDSGDHNGSTVLFGPEDGYLYWSVGDLSTPTPPDRTRTGQDVSDLHASIMRVDVDHFSEGKNYTIPKDNPFVDLAGARGEVYAYGFRNPWRMSFDTDTGCLWVGDVGWEAWEMVDRVVSGGNYGWSVQEGPGAVNSDWPVGPTPILPPDIQLPHTEAASVTGGIVPRHEHASLYGKYVFGDWMTRRYWAAELDGTKVAKVVPIADGVQKPISFAEDRNGDVLVLDYADGSSPSGIYRLLPTQSSETDENDFPVKLSQSGLFSDLRRHIPAAGVEEYVVNAPMWSDGAKTRFLIAIPGTEPATLHDKPQPMFDWFKTQTSFPVGTVLCRTVEFDRPNIESPLKIETQVRQLLAKDDWHHYTYRWNQDQSDAMLVASTGEQATFELPTSKLNDNQFAVETITWDFMGRSQCKVCHTPWHGESLSFRETQLRQPWHQHDELSRLIDSGIVAYSGRLSSDAIPELMVDPYDSSRDLDDRARSYLHANCANCHVFGNGSVVMELTRYKDLQQLHLVNEVPMKGDFGIEGGRLVVPGHPEQSIMLYRMLKGGSGRMPHIGGHVEDVAGIGLIDQWILGMDASRPKSEQHNIASENWDARFTDPVVAMQVVLDIRRGVLPKDSLEGTLARAATSPAEIRELYEPLYPESLRIERLGASFNPNQVLSIEGNHKRGLELYQQGVGQCSKCHRHGSLGVAVGPDFASIPPERRSKKQLLESIMQPSLTIEPNYASWTVVTDEGHALVGRMLADTSDSITVQLADGTTRTIDNDHIEMRKVNETSLMPAGLLDSLTAQQAADLIGFLAL